MATSVTVDVPVRACDVGGWTDTWFAGHGRVCSLAIRPGVSVTAVATAGTGVVTLDLPAYGLTCVVGAEPPEHRLLAEAVREAGVPSDLDVKLRVTSAVPPGSSLGTSAAVCVGVLAALDGLAGGVRSPAELAAAAHRVESQRLGRQSGVQDQIAAAHGGANLIEIEAYPAANAELVALSAATTGALDERLLHVAYGGGHDSSAVHEQVIAELTGEGGASPRLEVLRGLAAVAAGALRAGDLEQYGGALTAATDAQRALHPDLVSPAADELIELAATDGALGWKVNGAGGAGGSVSILCSDGSARQRLADLARRRGHEVLALQVAARGAAVRA